jgi:hypothetical protein
MMKTKILVLATFCLFTIAANAQFSIGVKGGLNVSSIEDLGPYSLDAKAGFHAGIMTQYMFNKNLGLESGLYYSLMGGKETEKDYDRPNRIDDYKASANPSYLQMPLYAIYKVELAENLSVYPSLGLYFGYGLNGKIDVKGIENGNDVTMRDDFFNDNNNRFDMGAGVGFNVQYKKAVFGLGYEHGFMKINKKDYPFDDDNSYNSNIKLSVGFFIN